MHFRNQNFVIVRFVMILAFLGTMLGMSPARLVHATTIVVNTNADDGPGSLRQAVLDSEDGGIITFAPDLAGLVLPLSPPLIIDKDLTIDGSALNPPLTLSGGPYTRIMKIEHPAKVTIVGLILTGGNATDGNGGAVYVESEFTAINSTFYNNNAENGGAIWGGGITLINSTLTGNSAGWDGGALGGVILDIRNTTIQSNQAYHDGGGISIYGDGLAAIINSTVFGNQAGNNGGGFFATGYTLLNFHNSTFAENTAVNGHEFMLGETRQVDFKNTVFVCNAESDKCYVPAGNTISSTSSILGTGTLQQYGLSEPADNGGPTKTMALLPDSQLIDAGDDAVCASALVNNLDQRGVTRPQRNHCDIGAYEDQPLVRYVKRDATGTGDGSSWANAHTDLQAALAAATSDEEIWVAAGTYRPTLTTDRTISFQLKNGVAIYGGFVGTETLRTDREYETNLTILSGDIGILGKNSDNSYHVVSSNTSNNSAVLDGFTITGGYADGSSPYDQGGGMYIYNGNPRIQNTIFTGNYAHFGGGIHNLGVYSYPFGSSDPILTNVVFENNTAIEGGGMRNWESGGAILKDVIFRNNSVTRAGGGMLNGNYSVPDLTNVTFLHNSAGDLGGGGGMFNWNQSRPMLHDGVFEGNTAKWGGGMANDQSEPNVFGVTFKNNSALVYGGGMSNENHSNPLLTNITFSGNTAVDGDLATYGGGVANQQSSPVLHNVTFYNNAATYGGAMINRDANSSPILKHVTISGNTAVSGGGIANSGSPVIVNSIIWGNTGGELFDPSETPVVTYSIVKGGYPGTGNLDQDPLLGLLQNNGGLTDTMSLGVGSPAIDAADEGDCPGVDQRGVGRPQGSGCDMGAYEYEVPALSPGDTVRVSVDSNGVQGDDFSHSSSISGDGRYVAFVSNATNLVLGDTNGFPDAFVHDLETGVTKRISVDSNGTQASSYFDLVISSNGRYVVFDSYAMDLVPNDTNGAIDIFIHDLLTSTTTRISVNSNGNQANAWSTHPSISADGRYVAFWSAATNLVPNDTNRKEDVFVRDLQTGTTRRVSVDSNGVQGNDASSYPSISANGGHVTFRSSATNLVPNDTNATNDIFLHDLQTGTTTRVSVDSSGEQANHDSFAAGPTSISADGRYVVFESYATNLVLPDTNGRPDVFMHDTQTKTTIRVSVDANGVQANYDSTHASISADGRFVAFESYATNLAAGDNNTTSDVFVRDIVMGTTIRVSVDSNNAQSNFWSGGPSISSDGSYVVFESDATNLVAGDTNSEKDIFVHRQEILPLPPTSAEIQVELAGSSAGSHTVPLHAGTRVSYDGKNQGPVSVQSTNSVPMIAAERVLYRINNTPTSFSEMMGLPANQLDTTYWLPWYNNVDLDTQLRFANVSGSPATVHIYIGGVEMTGSPFTLAAGESTRKSFPGVNNGPVKVVSDRNIVAAQRVIHKVNSTPISFSEIMALPNAQLDTTYWLPWYNNKDLDTQLRFANVTDQPATVHVFIDGVEMTGSPFTLAAGESMRPSFAGINNGPVKIVSDRSIVAAERVIYKVNGKLVSFSETMALPNAQLDTTYWFPWYNNKELDTQIRFANVSDQNATVHIYIGEKEMPGSPFTLSAGQSIRKSFPGISNGPVKIVSDHGVAIVAAERVIYRINNLPTSFSELMGLPNSLLDTTFWFPWYNNVDLDTQLRFGVP